MGKNRFNQHNINNRHDSVNSAPTKGVCDNKNSFDFDFYGAKVN